MKEKEAKQAAKGKKTKTKDIDEAIEESELDTKELDSESYTEPEGDKRRFGWTERLVGGGSLGGGYSNGWNVSVTPWVGYKVTDRFWAGIGLDYLYSSFKIPRSDFKEKFSVTAPKVFANYYVTPDINIATEYSRNFVAYKRNNDSAFRFSSPSWLAGAGYLQRFGKGGVRLEAFYDVLYNSNIDTVNGRLVNRNFRGSPWVLRINFVYGL